MSKHLSFFLGVVALATACSRSQKSREVQSLGYGATYVLDTTYTPGFLDPSFERDGSIVWPGGQRETLPLPGWRCGANEVKLKVAAGRVWLFCDRSLLVREGSPAVVKGEWRAWAIDPASNTLFVYLDAYAKSTGDVGVHRVPYITSKRIGDPDDHIVSGHEKETVTTIVYESKSSPAFSFRYSPTYDGTRYLLHKIKSIDCTNRIIYCFSDQSVPSMPAHLVFSPDPQRRNQWRFDRALTSELNTTTPLNPARPR